VYLISGDNLFGKTGNFREFDSSLINIWEFGNSQRIVRKNVVGENVS